MPDRIYNFSAGPAALPESVLKQAQEELLNYGSSGMSVMEMSHRSMDFENIINKAEAGLRQQMNIPDDYVVLFLQGGATLQFAMVPLNLYRSVQSVVMKYSNQLTKRPMKAKASVSVFL